MLGFFCICTIFATFEKWHKHCLETYRFRFYHKRENNKERFIELYTTLIQREGADKFLAYLTSEQSDFFKAPASTRFHGNVEGGLLEHSLHVYDRLKAIFNEDFRNLTGCNPSDETIALVSLLHDICKINVYKTSIETKKSMENGNRFLILNLKMIYHLDTEKNLYICFQDI